MTDVGCLHHEAPNTEPEALEALDAELRKLDDYE